MHRQVGNYHLYYNWYNKVLFLFFGNEHKFIRKIKGGTWYRMRTSLPMADIWVRIPFLSCQAFVVEIEKHPRK